MSAVQAQTRADVRRPRRRLKLFTTLGVAVGTAVLVRRALATGDLTETGDGFETLLVSVPLLIAASWSWVPSEAIAATQGASVGFVAGVLAAVFGWTVVAVLQYKVVSGSASSHDPEAMLARAPAWLRRMPVTHPLFLIAARQLPWGSKLVNIASPLVGVPLTRHAWCAAVGVLPTAIVAVGVGAGVIRL